MPLGSGSGSRTGVQSVPEGARHLRDRQLDEARLAPLDGHALIHVPKGAGRGGGGVRGKPGLRPLTVTRSYTYLRGGRGGGGVWGKPG